MENKLMKDIKMNFKNADQFMNLVHFVIIFKKQKKVIVLIVLEKINISLLKII